VVVGGLPGLAAVARWQRHMQMCDVPFGGTKLSAEDGYRHLEKSEFTDFSRQESELRAEYP